MIDRLHKLQINGVGQWLLERGDPNARNLVLFVHGGPGSPLMFFSRAFDSHLLDEFLVVHWDQRHSGKSYNADCPPQQFMLQEVIDDGIKLGERLLAEYAAQSISVVGHSWGKMVGAGMLSQSSNVFTAYISAGTVGSQEEAELVRYRLLREKLDTGTPEAKELQEIGYPPFQTYAALAAFGELFAKHVGIEGTWHSIPIDDVQAAVEKNQEYTEKELELTLEAMASVYDLCGASIATYDARVASPRIDVPVYFVQGRYDTNCPRQPALDYFNALDAPNGKYWLDFERSAHFPMYEEPERFLDVLRASKTGAPVE